MLELGTAFLAITLVLGILELLGRREMAVYFPHAPGMEDLRDACSRLPGISALRAGAFRHVRFGIFASRLENAVILFRERNRHAAGLAARLAMIAVLLACLWPAAVHAGGLPLPAGAERGLHLLYSGQPGAALSEFWQIEAAQPSHPLGYLLEAEVQWWQIYCEACEIKWNMVDAWKRPKLAADDAYLALADKGAALAEASIAKTDSAEMEFYAGMAWALRSRLLGLREERRATARAGVQARQHFLRCLELDPEIVDAYAGLGLYNYYVDTLSAMAKVMRFFMGIPGGDKNEGIRQLQMAAEHGIVTRVGARFWLAKNLRNYDLDYARSIEVIRPLVAEYPQNPIFQLLLADDHAKLNHKEAAEIGFRAAAAMPVSNAACAARIRKVVSEAIALLTDRTK